MATKTESSMRTGNGITTCLCLQFLLIAAAIVSTDGFVMSSCMAPVPCMCTLNEIICTSKNLTDVPMFEPTTQHVDNLTIYFPDNHLTVLPANAFRNINTTGATRITFFFQSNKLYAMDKDAFAGIENAVVELHFEDNKFTGLPMALATLTRLQKLHMHANPITSIDPLVSSLMSPSLTYFAFPAVNLASWPYGVNHLRHLSYLNMYGMPFHRLPLDAFNGFGECLTELHISGAFAGSIPSSVCFLRNLEVLGVNSLTIQSQQQFLQLHERCRELLSNVPLSLLCPQQLLLSVNPIGISRLICDESIHIKNMKNV